MTTMHSVRNGLLLACIGLSAAGWQARPPADRDAKPAPPTLRLAMSRLRPDAQFGLAGDRRLAVTAEAVWISSREAGTLARVDPKTNKIVKAIPTAPGGKPCAGLTAAFGKVWMPLCAPPALTSVDPKTDAVIPLTLPGIQDVPGPLAIAAGSIWMLANRTGTLLRIDPDTGKAVAEIYVAAGSTAVASGEGALWVVSGEKDLLTKIDPHTNVVLETIAVGRHPRALVVGEGSVWVLNQGDGSVTRVDPSTHEIETTIRAGVPSPNGEIAIGEGSVWLSGTGYPLTRIDPKTNRVVQQFSGDGGGAIAIGLGSIWLAATPASVWRLDPKLVEATR